MDAAMHLSSLAAVAKNAGTRVGYADYVVGTTITGWALDMLAPAEPVVLRAVIDGDAVDEVPCALPRDDVRNAGLPHGIGGFRYAIPADFRDGRPHMLLLELPGGAPVTFPSQDGALNPQHRFRIQAGEAAADYSDLADLLREHGILGSDFIKLFDVGDYLALNGASKLATTAQCIGHFARAGRPALCPIAVEWRFDPVFYSEIVPVTAGMSPPEAYLHWLNVGLPKEVCPNRSQFLKALGLTRFGTTPPEFDQALYLSLNPDVAATGATGWDALRHVIVHGLAEGRPGCPPPQGHSELYLAAADHLAMTDQLEAAKTVYRKILAAEPVDPSQLQHYADCLLRTGDDEAAEQVYLRIIEAGAGNILTELSLAQCRLRTGQAAEAARGLAKLQARLPGDLSVATRARSAAASCFDEAASQARQLAVHGFLAEGRARMAEAADILVQRLRHQPPAIARPCRPIRSLAIVADQSLPQCRRYRVEQKVEQLGAGGFAVQVFDQSCDLENFAGVLPFVDAVIFYRVAATPAVVGAIEAARTAGVVTFYEIDDLVFDPAHYPDSFASYAGLVSPEAYGDLVTGTELYCAAMSLCDYALASTPSLAAMMEPRVRARDAFVHRNGLDAGHLRHCARPPAGRTDGVMRIFYGTGTRAGNEDFELLAAPALDRLLRAHGHRVELVLMGHLSLPACLARHTARIRHLDPVWDLDSYWMILAQMDINLAVLKDTVLSDCKSEIKWLEAAMLGIPSVASPTATYRDVIDDDVTGLLAGTADAWFAALDRLVRDDAFRRSVGRAARARAVADYGPARSVANLRHIFRAVQAPDFLMPPSMPERKRVLIVNVFFPPQDIGGATRVVAENVRDLVREYGGELEIEVFATAEGGPVPYAMRSYLWNGVKVTTVTAGDGPQVDREADDPRIGELFDRVLQRFQPDLVHFHCIQRLTGAVCRVTQARSIPYFVTVHDGWWISDHQFLLDQALQRSLYHHADPLRQLEVGGADSYHRMTVLAGHLKAARRVLAVSEPFALLYRGCGFANVVVTACDWPISGGRHRTRATTCCDRC
jgi:tetratricopeptide (TPR) repeat protein